MYLSVIKLIALVWVGLGLIGSHSRITSRTTSNSFSRSRLFTSLVIIQSGSPTPGRHPPQTYLNSHGVSRIEVTLFALGRRPLSGAPCFIQPVTHLTIRLELTTLPPQTLVHPVCTGVRIGAQGDTRRAHVP